MRWLRQMFSIPRRHSGQCMHGIAGVHRHGVARGEALHAVADLRDVAGQLVAEHDREARPRRSSRP